MNPIDFLYSPFDPPVVVPPAPDSDSFDDDPTPPSGYPLTPDEVLPLAPCDICGEDACDHERIAGEDE